MKQHHQRVLRLWRCPECDRTVRLPGRVTSRTCQCMGEPTLMQLQETERFRTFDVDPFVSYQTEEDTTPTAAELVEEIPQHLMPVGPTEEEIAAKAAKPRRGKAYLRTEIDEEPESSPSTEDSAKDTDDFGAGIDDEATSEEPSKSPSKVSSSDAGKSQSTESSPRADSEGRGRKRKRRRRRKSGRREGDAAQTDVAKGDRSNSEGPSDSNPESVSSEPAKVQVGDNPEAVDSGASTEGNRQGKKRRRRRRRRGSGAGAANKGSENSSGGDSASNAPEPKSE